MLFDNSPLPTPKPHKKEKCKYTFADSWSLCLCKIDPVRRSHLSPPGNRRESYRPNRETGASFILPSFVARWGIKRENKIQYTACGEMVSEAK